MTDFRLFCTLLIATFPLLTVAAVWAPPVAGKLGQLAAAFIVSFIIAAAAVAVRGWLSDRHAKP